MKKCNLGKGTVLTRHFLSPELSWPGNLNPQVIPDIAWETRWLRFEYVGDLIESFFVHKLNRA